MMYSCCNHVTSNKTIINIAATERGGSSVYEVLILQHFVVMAPSPINILRKFCSIILMYGSALYAEDAFVYNRQLYTMH